MNKIYKVVWSKALDAYVVTSELAKSHAKNSSRKGLRRGITAALLAAVAVAPVSFGVYAADDTHYVSVNSTNKATDSNYDNDGAKAKNSIAIGPSVETTGEDNIVIGSGELGGQKGVTSVKGNRVLAIGHANYFQPVSDRNGQPVAYRDSAIIGHQNKLLQGDKDDAGGGTPAYQIVHGWKNTLKGSFTGAIGYENEIKNSSRPGNTSQNMAFTIGTENTIDATGYYMGDQNRVNTLPDYKDSSPVGANLYVIGRHNIIGSSKGVDWYVTSGHIVGTENIVYSNDANVFGGNNKVYSGSGIAIGNANKVGIDSTGNLVKNKKGRAIYESVAVGYGNIVTGDYGVALGVTAEARGEEATAVGSTAKALSDYSAALGSENRAKGYGSVAVGSSNNTYDFEAKQGRGTWKSFDSGDSSSAMGVMNISTGDYSSAVGVQNKALGQMASSFGYKNKTEKLASSSFGYSNQATERYSFAAGAVNQASGQFSSAVGGWNQAEGKKSQALGYQNFVSGHGAVAIGSENNLNFVRNYQAIGFVKTGDLSVALGISNATAGRKSMGLGSSNYLFGTKSAGIGMHNYSTGYETLAMGHYAVAGSEDPSKIDQVKYAAAIGNRARSTITDAVAIGSFSNTTRDKGDYGYDPSLKKVVTEADITTDANIGTYRAELEAARVAWQESMEKAEDLLHKIQTGQFANQAEYQQWGAEYDKLNADADAKQQAYDAAQKKVGALVGAWQGQMAALSVGDEATGRTRQITGVAAGSADTDAVNVAQLKAIDRKLAQGAVHYFSVKSDDSKNPDGTNWNNDGATGKNAIAIGKDAKAERESSVVIGLKASSGDAADDGVAVGSSASVTGFGGVAIGRESSAEGQETVAIGTGAKGAIHRTVAIGGYANADGFGAVAIGRDSSSKERGVALGNSSFSHAYSVGVGEKAIAEAPFSVAVGDLTGSYAMGAVTLGNKTRAFGDSSVAIGNQARVSGKGITPEEYEALSKADQKLYRLYEAVYYNYDDPSKPIVDRKYFKVIDAQDWRAEKHYNSIAIGTTSFVEAKEAIGIGAATRIHGDRGVALGYAAVSEENGTALGAGAQAKANAGVALGEGAVADTAAEVAGYDPLTGKASTETTPTWKSVKGAVSVGNADATRQITNLAAGLADTDAVNVAQLKAVQNIAAAKTTIEAGDNVTVEAGSADGSYKISATDTTLKADTNALSLKGNTLNLSVEDTAGNKVTGSVNLNDLKSAVDTNTTYTMTGTENAADNTTTISLKDSNGNEQKVKVATKDTNTYTTGGTYDAANKKITFTRNDDQTYDVDLADFVGNVTDTRNTIMDSDTVTVDASDKNADGSINYKLNVKTDGKIEKGNKGIVTGGTVYNETRIEKDGHYIKAGNTAGQNLIALDKQVDANTTNITKLENNIHNMGGRIGELGNRVDRVGAGAAALAALHPLDFDPDDKWDFAAGYGNYSGANAIAIGAYYRPNEDTMFSVGGSFGGGENMVNAGVSVKLGQGNNVTTSRVAMAREISDLKSKNEKMQEENKEMRNEIEILKQQMQKLMARK